MRSLCLVSGDDGASSAPLALIVIGAGIALTAARRKPARVRSDKITSHKKRPPEGGLKRRLSRLWLMDWPHRRAAYSRVPPLHLPQGACTRLCVLAQAKRSTANARALGGFRVAEPLMQRTGRRPVQVECCASGMPCTEQCLARSRTPFP